MYFWKTGFKYDMKRHGFKFEEKTTAEEADEKRAELKAIYGDIN